VKSSEATVVCMWLLQSVQFSCCSLCTCRSLRSSVLYCDLNICSSLGRLVAVVGVVAEFCALVVVCLLAVACVVAFSSVV